MTVKELWKTLTAPGIMCRIDVLNLSEHKCQKLEVIQNEVTNANRYTCVETLKGKKG